MENKKDKKTGEKVFDFLMIAALFLILWDLAKGYPKKLKTLYKAKDYLGLLMWVGIPGFFIIYIIRSYYI